MYERGKKSYEQPKGTYGSGEGKYGRREGMYEPEAVTALGLWWGLYHIARRART